MRREKLLGSTTVGAPTRSVDHDGRGCRGRWRHSDDLSVLGAVLPKEIDQALNDVVREVSGTDVTAGGHGRSNLCQVRLTGIACRQVLLEASTIASREGAVEIVAHELYRVAADQWRWHQFHIFVPFMADSTTPRTFARPRCKITRTFALLSPSSVATSSVDSPSTSRSVTTASCGSPSDAMALRTASNSALLSSRASTVSVKGTGGSLH